MKYFIIRDSSLVLPKLIVAEAVITVHIQKGYLAPHNGFVPKTVPKILSESHSLVKTSARKVTEIICKKDQSHIITIYLLFKVSYIHYLLFLNLFAFYVLCLSYL